MGTGISAAEFNVLDNEIALGTETSGNYVATVADAGNGTVSVTNGVAEGGAVTIDVIDLNCTNCIGPTEITDLTLGTDTAGNYVASANTSTLTGLTGGSAGSETANLTLAFDYTTALFGDPGFVAANSICGVSWLIIVG